MTVVAASGSVEIAARRDSVWDALHDAERLAFCIPGCESVRRDDAEHYSVRACVRLGPIKVAFDGTVAISHCEASRHLALVGQGRAGRAGSAIGSATLRLVAKDDRCSLTYRLKAVPAGPIAQLGSTVLGGLAQGMSDLFARRFAALFDEAATNDQAWRSRAKASRSATISPST